MNSDVVHAGLDGGFGYTKLAWRTKKANRIRTLTFPSVLGYAEESAGFTATLVNGGSRASRSQVIGYGGRDYFLGEEALRSSRLSGSRQDEGRIGSTEERILFLTALHKAKLDNVVIVTGLPVMWWQHRQKLVRSLTGVHELTVNGKEHTITIRQVVPVWQPFGTFCAAYLDKDGKARISEEELRGAYGILDIGANTTDLSGLNNLVAEPKWTGGLQVGVSDVLQIAAERIADKYGATRSPFELAVALMNGGMIQVYAEEIDIREIVEPHLRPLAEEIVGFATRKWKSADRMRDVLIAGGGAYLIGDVIQGIYPHNSQVVPNPALSNVLGFLNYAQRNIWKQV